MLDEADPALLQPCFERMETLLAEPPMREDFGRLGDRTLIAWDGTEYFCSQKLGCPNCLTRKRSNGKIESYHCLLSATVVAPGHAKVVPLMPEFIAPQDGAEKQDCERNAVKRWFEAHHARLARAANQGGSTSRVGLPGRWRPAFADSCRLGCFSTAPELSGEIPRNRGS